MENSNGRQPMFTTMQFGSVDDAQNEVKKASRKEIRNRIGLILSIISSASIMIALIFGEKLNLSEDTSIGVIMFWIVTMIISYILGGGILFALGLAWNIAKGGWYIVPLFPLCIVTGAIGLEIGKATLLFFPFVFVIINYIQTRKDKKAAEDYLASFGVQAA